MTYYRNILVPHTGDVDGDKALEHAIHIAEPGLSTITILHAIIPESYSLDERGTISIYELRDQLLLRMEHNLSKRVEKCKEKNINAQTKVSMGPAEEEILNYVKDNPTDIIVMSKRRKEAGLKGVFQLTRVSQRILEEVSCPITIVDVGR